MEHIKPVTKTEAEHHMALSLNRASKQGKIAKTTLQRALESGDLSAGKNEKGHWQIDESEFGRWLGKRSTEQTETSPENRNGTLIGTPEKTADISALETEVKMLRERLTDKDEFISDLQRRLDAEGEERRKLTALLTDQREQAPEKPRRGFWARLVG